MHVVANGVRVSYTDQGEGVPLVLLHGGMVTGGLMWTTHAEELAKTHRVLVPDTRGHGGSDNPDDVFGYRVAGQCSAFQGGGEGPCWEGRQARAVPWTERLCCLTY